MSSRFSTQVCGGKILQLRDRLPRRRVLEQHDAIARAASARGPRRDSRVGTARAAARARCSTTRRAPPYVKRRGSGAVSNTTVPQIGTDTNMNSVNRIEPTHCRTCASPRLVEQAARRGRRGRRTPGHRARCQQALRSPRRFPCARASAAHRRPPRPRRRSSDRRCTARRATETPSSRSSARNIPGFGLRQSQPSSGKCGQ